MTERKYVITRKATVGDAAVDGLLAGGGAGLAMAVYLLVVSLMSGMAWSALLGRFDPSPQNAPLTGALAHLAVAGVYGVLFGLAAWFTPRRWRRRLPGWLMGLAYGLLLWLLAQTVLLPGANLPLQTFPRLHFALGHAVYGLVLGLLINQTGAFSRK